MKHKFLLPSVILIAGLGVAFAPGGSAEPTRGYIPFDELSLTLEINAADRDAGVLFKSDTSKQLEHLLIHDPAGRTIFQLRSSDLERLGLTEIFWETAEPDIQTALNAYPPGPYRVTALTFDGVVVRGVTRLSHDVLPPPDILQPTSGAQLPIDGVVVKWTLDPNADHYWLEIEADALDYHNVIELQPGASEFEVPEALLTPATDYKVSVGVVGGNGNAVVEEVEFFVLP